MTTTTNTNSVTVQDIIDVTPRNGDLEVRVDDIVLHVVGADGARNVIFVDPDRDVHTEMTFEIYLNDFSSLERICDGYYRLTPAGIRPRCTQSVDEDLELPF